MPVARRKYDITPTEIMEVARGAADAVVDELKARRDELSSDRTAEVRQLAEWLAQTVLEASAAATQEQTARISAVMEEVRASTGAAGQADGHLALLAAFDARLEPLLDRKPDDGLPLAVAEAVADRVLGDLARAVVPDSGVADAVADLRGAVRELLEQNRVVEGSRSASLDRLDEVLVDLRSGITANLARQHAVLLEVLDTRLAELRLTEMADELPSRIGAVISDSIERAHTLELDVVASLRADLASAIDAGLDRQRAAVTQLSDAGERLSGFAAEVSETVERLVAASFERAQGAQMQRITALVKELRAQQEEALDSAVERLEVLVTAGLERQNEVLTVAIERQEAALEGVLLGIDAAGDRQAATVSEALERQEAAVTRILTDFEASAAAAVERQDAALEGLVLGIDAAGDRQTTALTQALERQEAAVTRILTDFEASAAAGAERQERALDKVLTEIDGTLSEGLVRQEDALSQVRQAEQRVLDLLEDVPDRVTARLAEAMTDSASRATRVENLLAELAWSLGEMRAGNEALRSELSRVASVLPESAAALHDVAGRSEARVVDLIARLASGGTLPA